MAWLPELSSWPPGREKAVKTRSARGGVCVCVCVGVKGMVSEGFRVWKVCMIRHICIWPYMLPPSTLETRLPVCTML